MWYIADAPFDLILWLDLILNFFYPYRDAMNLWVDDFKKTAKRYAVKEKLGLWTDLISLFLLDWIPVAVATSSNDPSQSYRAVWRLNRALLFFRALKRFPKIEALIPAKFASIAKMFKLLNFVIIVAMSVHISSCVWFSIVMAEYPDSQVFTLSASIFEPSTTTLYKYMYGFYWSLVSMAGYGGTMPVSDLQVAFVAIIYLVGIAVFVTVIGIVSSLAQDLNVTESAFIEKVDAVTDYINSRGLSASLKKQILQYYQYLWKSRKGLDESKIIRELPDFLKIDVAMQLNADIVKKVELFKSCSQNFIHEVVINLKPRIVMPGSYVIREGEPGNEMFFIGKGVVEVRSKTGVLWSTLGSGSFVGETALIDSVKRTANVISIEYVDLFVLEKEAFDEIMSTYPEDAKNVIATSEARKQMNKQKAAQSALNLKGDTIPYEEITKLLEKISIGLVYQNVEGNDLFKALSVVIHDPAEVIIHHMDEYLRNKNKEMQSIILPNANCADMDQFMEKLKKGEHKAGETEVKVIALQMRRTIIVANPIDGGKFIIHGHDGSTSEVFELHDLSDSDRFHKPVIIITSGKPGVYLATRKK
ncbi:cyclic nucleotide gated channel alpha [Naegleria gruberi]|uniref:Cyclic nucleotide gated channel alpha n=1 Tax=Naegleria gruberi TaxID=5762 RepID=D2UXD1_NAEGR|nr:cyclic nucleotide gated channel alpha [Naegleria gruberi]EFC50264.1 cyclic nucleotide gated channel alpha [Naegleria gruberi]|eukprot:XP_002683008.1 cyclic nucleotide gated channel alpha [Naegleria gruberi strain NEG-M]